MIITTNERVEISVRHTSQPSRVVLRISQEGDTSVTTKLVNLTKTEAKVLARAIEETVREL